MTLWYLHAILLKTSVLRTEKTTNFQLLDVAASVYSQALLKSMELSEPALKMDYGGMNLPAVARSAPTYQLSVQTLRRSTPIYARAAQMNKLISAKIKVLIFQIPSTAVIANARLLLVHQERRS